MLDQLLATPGVQERCVLGSSFGFLALHGGLEAGTAEIAQAAAVASNASVYAVVQPDDVRWHVPSHAFDPSQSDALVAFLEHVDVRRVGARLRRLARRRRPLDHRACSVDRTASSRRGWPSCCATRCRAIAGSTTSTGSRRTCAACIPANPVNRAHDGGVQIELPPRVRKTTSDCAALVGALAAVAV